MRFLVDTNVVSEACKAAPNPTVLTWLDEHADELYLSVITIEEMRFGELMMPQGKKRRALHEIIDGLLEEYDNRTLAFGVKEAQLCAQYHEQAISSGHTPSIEDLMIAAIAHCSGCTLATRNIKDFAYLNIAFVNPYD